MDDKEDKEKEAQLEILATAIRGMDGAIEILQEALEEGSLSSLGADRAGK